MSTEALPSVEFEWKYKKMYLKMSSFEKVTMFSGVNVLNE